jgi:hypothetical protein
VVALSKAERKELKGLGLSIGAESCYLSGQTKDRSGWLRALLWCLRNGQRLPARDFDNGAVLRPKEAWPDGLCLALGYLPIAREGAEQIALRADVLERLAGRARRLSSQGAFRLTPDFCRPLGGSQSEAEAVLLALGYRRDQDKDGEVSFRRGWSRRPQMAKRAKRRKRSDGDSDGPFAVLKGFAPGK